MPRPSAQIQAAVVSLGVLLVYLLSRSGAAPGAPAAVPVPGVPEPPAGEPSFTQRVVAIGDLHGDIHNALRVLRLAGVVDSSGGWAGGDAVLVQTGDIVDRGTYALDIYRLFQRLRGEAAAVGGRVVSVLGNHEYMNALGDWRYVTPDDIKHFGGVEARQRALSADGWLGQEWLAKGLTDRSYSVTALVPLCDRAFCPALSFTHGSLLPSHPSLEPYPARLNALGRSLLARALAPPLALPHPPAPYAGLPDGTTPAEAGIYDGGGPLWWRGLAETADEATVCAWADELKRRTGARRIIGGHTPDFEKIVARCGASVIIIDTGMSSAYGGVLSALEIVYTLTPAGPELLAQADASAAARPPASDGAGQLVLAAQEEEGGGAANKAESARGEREGAQTGGKVQARTAETGELKAQWVEREVVSTIYERRKVRLAVEQRVVS